MKKIIAFAFALFASVCFAKAVNAADRVAITLNVTGAGSLSFAGNECRNDGKVPSGVCTFQIDRNTKTTIVAQPGSGFTIASWGGDACTGQASTCSFTADVAKNITIVFTGNTRPVSVGLIGSGSVTSDDGSIRCQTTKAKVNDGVCSANLTKSAQVTLTAKPADGFVFTKWSGDCSSTATTCKLSIDQAKAVSAYFDVTGAKFVPVFNPNAKQLAK